MMLLLAFLFVVATAIGCYVAVAVTATLLQGHREPSGLGSPHTQP